MSGQYLSHPSKPRWSSLDGTRFRRKDTSRSQLWLQMVFHHPSSWLMLLRTFLSIKHQSQISLVLLPNDVSCMSYCDSQRRKLDLEAIRTFRCLLDLWRIPVKDFRDLNQRQIKHPNQHLRHKLQCFHSPCIHPRVDNMCPSHWTLLSCHTQLYHSHNNRHLHQAWGRHLAYLVCHK